MFVKSDSRGRGKMKLKMRIGWLLMVTVTVMVSMVSGGSVNDCYGVRNAYTVKGLALKDKDVPRQPRHGKTDDPSGSVQSKSLGEAMNASCIVIAACVSQISQTR